MGKCNHKWAWHNTSIGGFAQCVTCSIVSSDIQKSECVLEWIYPKYVPLKTEEELKKLVIEHKARKKAEREKIRQATIEWLKKNKK